MKPQIARGLTTVRPNQILRPRQMRLCAALDKAPLKTTNFTLSEHGQLIGNCAIDGPCHPFSAQHRAVQHGQVVDKAFDLIGAPIGVKRDDIRMKQRAAVNFGLLGVRMFAR